MSSTSKQYQTILTSRPVPSVGLIILSRPRALNALNAIVFKELSDALQAFDHDDDIGAVVLTGSQKVFAAGADIEDLKNKQFVDAYRNQFLALEFERLQIRKPLIAAVSGFALGGGCELALGADIILASPTAKFGQPEITLGTIPGAGGSQRLTRAIGKSRAMELILSGRVFTAQEAERWGVVSRVVGEGEGQVVKEAVELGRLLASRSRFAIQAAKEAVNSTYEQTLTEGLRTERRLFHMTFATKDQKEGATAFVEKRKPRWAHL